MTRLRISLSLQFILIAALLLASCSQENASEVEVQQAKPPVVLLDVPRPEADTLQADVAVLLQNSWSELNKALADKDLNAQARAEAYANYGLIAFGNGLTLPAEAAFENATLLAADDARWIYFLALLHQYKGALDKAVTHFERVLELQPGNLPALIRFADTRFEQARMEMAGTLYQRALDLDSQSAAAHYGLGRVASAIGEHRRAADHFEAALKLQPYADRINYFLGLTWRNLGDRDKAQDYLAKRGTNEPHFADPLFDEISGGETRIDGLWVHMNAGSQAFVDGDYAVAVDEFRLATKDLPNESRSWQSLAMALNKIGDREGAEAAYRKVLDLSRNNAVVHHELAKLKMVGGQLQQAETHFKQAIEIDPRMLEAHTNFAKLLVKAGRADEALIRYEAALALDPQSGELAVSRAETLIALGRTADAVAALRGAAQTNPLDANVRMTYGLVLADSGKNNEAMAEVKKALDAAEDNDSRSRAHYAIGYVHLKNNDAEAAFTSFGDALKLNSGNRAAGLELARTFIRLQDFENALGTYKVLLNNWPENDGARLEAARVALRLGKGPEARRLLQAGVEKEAASARLLGSMARLLVLATDANVRDPELALKHAQRALQINTALQHSETLALCHAAAGQFSQAVELQTRLIAELGSDVSPKVRTRMEQNLQRYRAKELGRLPFDAF